MSPSALPPWIQSFALLLVSTQVTDHEGGSLPLEDGLKRAQDHLGTLKRRGRKALVIGNGGSAAIASHVQTDLVHSLGIRALVLHEPSMLTAQSNDHGYENAFRNLSTLWADAEDLMILVSSSGRSQNILKAADLGRARGMTLITFTGFSPENPLRILGDLNYHVASSSYGAVESAHAVLLHQITDRTLAALSQGDQP